MTPIYHNNVSQFQHIAPSRALRGGGTENAYSTKKFGTSKTCASGGARFLDPTKRKGSVRVAENDPRMGHQITPKSIKKRYHRQRRKQSCFKSAVGLTLAEFRSYHEGERPSEPSKGCSKSDFACMRYTTLTNTV